MNLSGSSLCVHDIYFLCSGFIISLSLFIFAISIICYLIFSLVYPVWAKIIFYFLLNFFSDDEQCNWNGEWGACENALAQARTWEQSERIKKTGNQHFLSRVSLQTVATSPTTSQWWVEDEWKHTEWYYLFTISRRGQNENERSWESENGIRGKKTTPTRNVRARIAWNV